MIDITVNSGESGGGALPRERADAQANRARILAAARRLFAERGVAEVCMSDIAVAAGVGKGTLYRRFANKGALCYALMDGHLNDFQDATLRRLQEMTAANISVMAQLDAFLDSLVYFVADHMPLLAEVQGVVDLPGGSARPHFWLHMTIAGLLERAVAAGEVAPHLDVDYTAAALLAPLDAVAFAFQRDARGFDLARISAGLRALAAGLAVRPTAV